MKNDACVSFFLAGIQIFNAGKGNSTAVIACDMEALFTSDNIHFPINQTIGKRVGTPLGSDERNQLTQLLSSSIKKELKSR
jgi:hypothetical protein